MDDIAQQLARRDRFRRALYARQSASERIEGMKRLQQATWDALNASASGYARFLRRNFRKRAIELPARDADADAT